MSGGLLFQAVVYLAAAVVAVPVAKRLGLGSVLGYLAAGVAIGPFALGFVGEERADVLHFAELGVVLMLFVVGLELEPARLWRLRGPLVGLGGAQVVASSLVLAALALALGSPGRQAVAIGMTLALSSTAIVLQSLQEKGLLGSAGGQSTFAVLLFQDIAVIPMLALVPLLAPPSGGGAAGDRGSTWIGGLPGWSQALAVLAAVAAVVGGGRYLVRPALRAIAATRLRELFTAAALLLVVGIALLMTTVGLSPALGTFLAGVVLANSEYRHELESDLEPFKGLLLGLFFIAVGASIDFALLAARPLALAGLVAGIVLVKLSLLFLLGRLSGLGPDSAAMFAFSLAQVGEFAFVLFAFAAQEGVLPQEVVAPLVASVAFSMALTPLLLVLYERLVRPRLGTRESATRVADEVDERQRVLIAGFGAFGSTVGRLLRANGVAATVLDFDGDRVDLLRRLGLRVHYGDATRVDLLRAAGAEQAELLVLALDSPESTLALVETVRQHFPRLRIYARAFDWPDAHDLLEAGVEHVYRQSLDTALRLAEDALRDLGFRAHRAHRAAQTFRRHDERALAELTGRHRDTRVYLSEARRRIEELERRLAADLEAPDLDRDAGWDPESLRRESGAALSSRDD